MTCVASLVQFYLTSKTSVLLMGDKGCGKSVVFSKVAMDLKDTVVFKYINLTRHLTDVEYEVSLLQSCTNDANAVVVVVENFDLDSVVHVHFINSLMNGRSVVDRAKASRLVQLPKFVLFVEACMRKTEDQQLPPIPGMLAEQMVSCWHFKSYTGCHIYLANLPQ